MLSDYDLSSQEWPEEDYPPYANGPGYVLSTDIARFIVSEFEKHKLRVSIFVLFLRVSNLYINRSITISDINESRQPFATIFSVKDDFRCTILNGIRSYH